ncbi:MAG: hypothetical protein AMXMBFR53_09910 [Gemmatimonadota bacterium]
MPHPLHPAVVHFPVVLAVLLPFLAAVGALVARRPGVGRGPWLAVAAFAVLLPLTAWAALATGQAQEEVVEGVVAEAPIHQHEEAAEVFLAGSAFLALVALAGLLSGRAGGLARVASVPVALVVLALGFRVGASGGELVYTHGAAAAYLGASGAAAPSPGGAGGSDDDEGRERRRRDD